MSNNNRQFIGGETKVTNKYGGKMFQPDQELKKGKNVTVVLTSVPSKME